MVCEYSSILFLWLMIVSNIGGEGAWKSHERVVRVLSSEPVFDKSYKSVVYLCSFVLIC